MVPPGVAEVAAKAQRELAGRVLAITLRSVRDLDIAEEATADAFLLALQTWPERGVPSSVEAWLMVQLSPLSVVVSCAGMAFSVAAWAALASLDVLSRMVTCGCTR